MQNTDDFAAFCHILAEIGSILLIKDELVNFLRRSNNINVKSVLFHVCKGFCLIIINSTLYICILDLRLFILFLLIIL